MKLPAGNYRVTDTGCWIWQGSLHTHGYGKFRQGGRDYYAHRVSYEMNHGPMPKGLEIDHLCRTKACCNPAHLEAVTHAENLRRIKRPQPDACRKGHPLTPGNFYETPTGRKRCRVCFREARYARLGRTPPPEPARRQLNSQLGHGGFA